MANARDWTGGNAFISRVYASKSVDETQKAYDEWAAIFDKDMVDAEYVAPALVAAQTVKLVSVDEPILDAGCGTGLVGVQLAKLGAKTIDGNDLSQGMLDVARKAGVYRELNLADLSRPMHVADGTYGAVACSGTLTQGHVGPAALADFLRVVKTGGVVVATVLDPIYESAGYQAEVQRLGDTGEAEILSEQAHPYRRSSETLARIVVLKKR